MYTLPVLSSYDKFQESVSRVYNLKALGFEQKTLGNQGSLQFTVPMQTPMKTYTSRCFELNQIQESRAAVRFNWGFRHIFCQPIIRPDQKCIDSKRNMWEKTENTFALHWRWLRDMVISQARAQIKINFEWRKESLNVPCNRFFCLHQVSNFSSECLEKTKARTHWNYYYMVVFQTTMQSEKLHGKLFELMK